MQNAMLNRQLDALLREGHASGRISYDPSRIVSVRQDQRDRITVGTTKQTVLEYLGGPMLSVESTSGEGYEVLFFCMDISEKMSTGQRGILQYRNMFWPVFFEGDCVVGSGWAYYEEYFARHENADQADWENLLRLLSRTNACEWMEESTQNEQGCGCR